MALDQYTNYAAVSNRQVMYFCSRRVLASDAGKGWELLDSEDSAMASGASLI